jgi:hypothetical protein
LLLRLLPQVADNEREQFRVGAEPAVVPCTVEKTYLEFFT